MSRLFSGRSGGEDAPPSPSAEPVETPTEEQSENTQVKIDNTKALQRIAAQSQKLDKTLINAGAKAYSNQNYDEAIIHYQQAISINPSDGSVYNNIGNVYLRGKRDPQSALPYYVQATTIQPSFNYGWLNLALCQKELGNISGAKETVSLGLKELNSEDGLYDVLTQLQSQLENHVETSVDQP